MDGVIAGRDGDASAFPQEPSTTAALFERYPETCPTHARAALGVSGQPQRFDTVLMGYRTYEPTLAAGLPGGVVLLTSRRQVGRCGVMGDLGPDSRRATD